MTGASPPAAWLADTAGCTPVRRISDIVRYTRSCRADAGDKYWVRYPARRKSRRKGEGKSRPVLPPTRAGIAIKGHLTRATIGLQKADHRFHCGMTRGSPRLPCANSAIEVPTSTRIVHLDHLLALADGALCSRRHTTHIFAHPSGSPPTAPEAESGWRFLCGLGRIQPVLRRSFQTVRLDRGKRTPAACRTGSRGR